jgi:putative acetyltransferase
VAPDGVVIRPAGEADFDAWFEVFEAVAAEGKWIGRELPVDREEQRQRFLDAFVHPEGGPFDGAAGAFVAEAGGQVVGHLGLRSHRGIGDVGMAVMADWRGRGVGSALLSTALDWARAQGFHKLTLQLWPHNTAALRLYQKFGFVDEGRLHRHYRRRNGELWDALVMGLVLDTTSPGSPFAAGEEPAAPTPRSPAG